MKTLRRLSLVLLVVLFVGILQADTVVYYDRATKKEERKTGQIKEEGPANIKVEFRGAKELVTIDARDIRQLLYTTKEVDNISFSSPFGREDRGLDPKNEKTRGKMLLEAQVGYTKLKDAVSRPEAKRYLEFKIASVKALRALDEPAVMEDAIKSLRDFKTAHPGTWEVLPTLKSLARLQEDSGKIDDARKTYEEMAELPEAPAELKSESALLVGRLLLRSGKHKEAQQRLEKLATAISRDDMFAPFVKVYLAQSQMAQNNLGNVQNELTDAIRNSPDPRLRGLAHNLLGDYYLKKGDQEEAFWHYLRVDSLYDEDIEQHAKAMYHLAGLFEKIKKDPQRGKEYIRKLLDKRYSGTSAQKQAVSEGKKVEGEK